MSKYKVTLNSEITNEFYTLHYALKAAKFALKRGISVTIEVNRGKYMSATPDPIEQWCVRWLGTNLTGEEIDRAEIELKALIGRRERAILENLFARKFYSGDWNYGDGGEVVDVEDINRQLALLAEEQ